MRGMLWASVLHFSVGCGEVAKVPDASPPEIFAHPVARAACEGLRDCCAADRLTFDENACTAVIEGDAQSLALLERERGVDFHEEKVPDCLAGVHVQLRAGV